MKYKEIDLKDVFIDPDEKYKDERRKRNEIAMKRFDDFRKELFASNATDEQKQSIWRKFITIYTGVE